MKKYHLIFSVREAHGTQTFLVLANSKAEALAAHNRGESELEDEEIEVMGLSEPEIEEVQQ